MLACFCGKRDKALVQAVLDRALPMIVVDQPLLPKVPFIGIDDRGAARACARHLKDLGHRRIGIVAFALQDDGYSPPSSFSTMRSAAPSAMSATSCANYRLEGVYLYRQIAASRGAARAFPDCL